MSHAKEMVDSVEKLSSRSVAAVTTTSPSMPRRDFLKAAASAGAGLWIAAYVPELAARSIAEAPIEGNAFAPNAFVRIAPDETVTVIANHS